MDDTAPSAPIVEQAFAKINLNLHVNGRRRDGYHMIESLVAFADIADVLTFEDADDLSLAITGPFARRLSTGDENLVVQAVRSLAHGVSTISPKAAITLRKNLPLAAGLGGGSADAAAALRGLARLSGETLSPHAVVQVAAAIGSDVPVCLLSSACFISGTGTLVEPVAQLPPVHVVLANPNVPVATQDVYQALGFEIGGVENVTRAAPPPGPFRDLDHLIQYLRETRNDLEPVSASLAFEIGDCIDALFAQSGCLLARMSGSGATCFGLFAGKQDAHAAGAAIREQQPDWWVTAGTLS